MNCLYTINVGNFMGSKARESFRNAAARWCCEFRELDWPCDPLYPGCSKFQFAHNHGDDYQKLMFLDADAVISEHAPNPFALCTEGNRLYVVSDYYGPNISDDWRLHAFYEPLHRCLKHRSGRIMEYDQFFNGGMFMFVRSVETDHFFEDAFNAMLGPDKFDEQAMFNLLAFNSQDIYIRYLPEAWNYMVRVRTGPNPEYYVNHYGGEAQPLIADHKEPQCTDTTELAAPAATEPSLTPAPPKA